METETEIIERLKRELAAAKSVMEDVREAAFTGCLRFGNKNHICNCGCVEVVNMLTVALKKP